MYLRAIHQLDPEAKVVTITSGLDQGKYQLQTVLRLPDRRAGEAPAGGTPDRAVRAYWLWILAVPSVQWITFASETGRDDEAYRWTPDGWLRRPPLR